MRGVIDSEDLPLNISREMLQNNPQVTQIRNGLVGRVIGELESAACLVAEGQGPDRELERLLALQDRGTGVKPVLEINTRHGLVKAISAARLGGRGGDVSDLAELLYDQARILDGEVPDDPAAFTARVNRLVMRGIAAEAK